MQVPNDRIDAFIDLWERAFDERITRDQARIRAHQLIELHRAITEDLTHRNEDVPPPPPTYARTPGRTPSGGFPLETGSEHELGASKHGHSGCPPFG